MAIEAGKHAEPSLSEVQDVISYPADTQKIQRRLVKLVLEIWERVGENTLAEIKETTLQSAVLHPAHSHVLNPLGAVC